MSTLIGLAAKLPAQHADVRPRLQVDLAWANVVLHRLAAAEDALRLAEVGIDSVPTDEAGDLRAELDLIVAVIAAFQDRIDASTDAAVQACVDRADTLRPFILCRAADLASFRALRGLDFDDALRWQRWGRQYHQQISGDAERQLRILFCGDRRERAARRCRRRSAPATRNTNRAAAVRTPDLRRKACRILVGRASLRTRPTRRSGGIA